MRLRLRTAVVDGVDVQLVGPIAVLAGVHLALRGGVEAGRLSRDEREIGRKSQVAGVARFAFRGRCVADSGEDSHSASAR